VTATVIGLSRLRGVRGFFAGGNFRAGTAGILTARFFSPPYENSIKMREKYNEIGHF
jgi:hypothetical protein